MSDSPAEYVERLKRRVAVLETALKMELDARHEDRERFRAERAEWQGAYLRLQNDLAGSAL